MAEKTISNPSTPGKISKFLVEYENGTAKEVIGVGMANAWFISSSIWPNDKIVNIKEVA
jgi:hypothetical protein